MKDSVAPITITVRIPGTWGHPRELLERIPAGCQLTPEALTMPDGSTYEMTPMPADGQFAHIFRSSCRKPAMPDELEVVKNYKVNICLSGPGGSSETAHAMMKAVVAILDAGGAGVFIDNSAIAHGATLWREMTEDGGPDALSYAYVTIVRGKIDVYTFGMHVLGLRDLIMKRTDIEEDGYDIIEVIRYMSAGEKPMDDGHIIADLDGPRFKAVAEPSIPERPGSVMHNPFGKLRLVSLRDLAERN